MASSFMVGESLVGDGNEVAHIDLLIGSKDGPVGEAFAEALINQKEGHTNLLAVVAPNLPAKPDTIMANKVTIKGATQAVQMFGPAQAAVARAVVDSVREGVISERPGGRPLHHRRRLHPLGGDRRQEDLRLQLPGDEGVDRPRAGQRAQRADGRSTARPRRGTRSPEEPRGSATPDRTSQPASCRLDGVRAVVTGASSGIGAGDRRSVRRRRRDRAHHLPPQRGGRARGRRRHRGDAAGDALVARADLGTRAGCEALVAEARERLGGLDVWVNNAGADVLTGDAGGLGLGAQARPPARRRPQGHDRVLVRGRRRDARAGRRRRDREHELGPRHERHGRRRTPSSSARSRAACSPTARASRARSRRRCGSTSCARAGSRPRSASSADEGFRREVAESTPLRRWGTPADVAAAAVYLASPAAAFITGQAINVNGGIVM